MRKILTTYLPASLLLAFLGMVLFTCGGGGGGGGGSSKTLTGLSIDGPSSVSEYGAATYTATASWDDNTTSTVTPTWEVDLPMASISNAGELYCQGIDTNETVTITATYSSGGVDEMATMDVTVTNVTTIPYTEQMLSGVVLFEEIFPEEGGYEAYLFYHNVDHTYEADWSHGLTEDSGKETGTWSIGGSGELILNYDSGSTFTAWLISDSSTGMEVLVDDGSGRPWIENLEKTVPIDSSLLPGTYDGSDGYTWIFNADQTGTIPDFEGGGLTFTWSVDSEGVLRMAFDTGYTGSFYARATSQSTATEYTILKGGFTEHNTSTGAFFKYYGGIVLTRQ